MLFLDRQMLVSPRMIRRTIVIVKSIFLLIVFEFLYLNSGVIFYIVAALTKYASR
jgi:hypothetical protein